MLAGQLALIAAALFSGAAIYVIACEQPARLRLDDRALLAEWRSAYKRGTLMQAPLALIGAVLGALAWWQAGHWPWLAGAVVIVANWPYTLLVIKPVNDVLQATDPSQAGSNTRAMIERWGFLHGGRIALGVFATVLFLWASLH